MNHLQRELNSVIDDAIREYAPRDSRGYRDADECHLEEFPDFVQDEIVKLYWETNNRDLDALFSDEDTDNIKSSIVKMLDKTSTLNKLDVADNFHKSLKNYYLKSINTLIEERITYIKSWSNQPSAEREDYYLGAY